MLYIKVLLILSLLLWLPANSQFHLYHTDRAASKPPLFFDCLYYRVHDDIKQYDIHSADFHPALQVIPYCLRPAYNDDGVKKEENDSENTSNARTMGFNDLRRNGVTISNLLTWSASIDILELYHEYLHNLTNATIHHVFYNCTWPWFGPMCQYTFDAKEIRSFNSIVRDTFIKKEHVEPNDFYYPTWFTNLTCYNHLKCNRGPEPLCLDWREVCDGQVDCLDDGIDETGCFPLHTNVCNKDEFQCDNGMCIPASFANDSPYNFDCTDGSDEKQSIIGQSFSHCIYDPAFRCEELAYINSIIHLFCGDGQTCTTITDFKWCCRNGRSAFLQETLLSRRANTQIVDDKCWFIMYCAKDLPVLYRNSVYVVVCHFSTATYSSWACALYVFNK
jgi:hypothetical protein